MELITKLELAKILSISTSKIEKDMVKGLPYHKFGKAVRYNLEEVLAYYKEEK